MWQTLVEQQMVEDSKMVMLPLISKIPKSIKIQELQFYITSIHKRMSKLTEVNIFLPKPKITNRNATSKILNCKVLDSTAKIYKRLFEPTKSNTLSKTQDHNWKATSKIQTCKILIRTPKIYKRLFEPAKLTILSKTQDH